MARKEGRDLFRKQSQMFRFQIKAEKGTGQDKKTSNAGNGQKRVRKEKKWLFGGPSMSFERSDQSGQVLALFRHAASQGSDQSGHTGNASDNGTKKHA